MWLGLSAATTVTHRFFRITFFDGLRFANPSYQADAFHFMPIQRYNM